MDVPAFTTTNLLALRCVLIFLICTVGAAARLTSGRRFEDVLKLLGAALLESCCWSAHSFSLLHDV